MSDYDNTDIVDNSAEFGVPIGVKVVLQQTSHDAPYAQLDSKTPFWFPQAKHYASVEVNSERVNFLGDTRASFRSGIVNPERSLLFYNDGAQIFYDRAQPYILEESIWHSEIMYQNEFRCDASTEWTWRWKPVKADVHIDEGCVIAQNSQSGIFFHWFFDVVSKIWLFQRHFPGSKSKFFCGSVTQSYKIATLSAFQISPEQIIEPPADDL